MSIHPIPLYCEWDSLGFPSVSVTSRCTVGWDGHLGLGVLYMGQLGIPQCVHYFRGTVGWDGHLGFEVLCMGHLGITHCVHCFPWYSGMGWIPGIGGIVHGTPWDIPRVCSGVGGEYSIQCALGCSQDVRVNGIPWDAEKSHWTSVGNTGQHSPPVLPFLLKQNLSPKNITGSNFMKLNVS